jgi:oligopeptide/dipeptide ABC transporter ATP-binding protein
MAETAPPLLQVRNLSKSFPVKGNWLEPGTWGRRVLAVEGVSFDLAPGETLGLVGESGCGKTTTGRLILGLDKASSGDVRLGESPNLLELRGREWLPYRRRMQMVFQDPDSSLNPRMTAEAIVTEALTTHHQFKRTDREKRIGELFDQVGLPADSRQRFPHEFSGGQRQRIGIARALAVSPEVIIADEPVSALDVSIQAQILNLLVELQQRHGLAFLFISHSLSVVGHLCHRVLVMYLGRIVENAPTDILFKAPLHPYTQALMEAVPQPDPTRRTQRQSLSGDQPDSTTPPSGCPFHPRCLARRPDCSEFSPELLEIHPGHFAACHLYASPTQNP